MPDIQAISTGLSSIKSAIDIAKVISSADKEFEKAELKIKISELTDKLIESKNSLLEAKDILKEKDDEIRKLRDLIDLKEDIIYEDPFYYVAKNEDKIGPYCQACFDESSKLIKVQKVRSRNGSHQCKVCGNFYGNGHTPQVSFTSL